MNTENLTILINSILDKKIEEKLDLLYKEKNNDFENLIDTIDMKFNFIDDKLNEHILNKKSDKFNKIRREFSFKTLLFLK